MKYVAYIASTVLALGASVPAHADTTTFGQFLQRNSSARLFQYLNQDHGATKGATIRTTGTASGNTVASIPIYYIMSVGGLPTDLTGLQNAHLTIDFVSNLGTSGTGVSRVQMFDTITSGSISIVRDSAAAEGANTKTNLLTVSFSNAELDASNGSGSFTFKTNPSSTITYTSDFLDFSHVVAKDFSFSFSGASPTYNATVGSSGRSTRFSGTGTFASDPAPLIPGVPEASTWAMMVLGFGAAGFAMRTGRRKDALTAI
jgi:hypothetical protein